MFMYAVVIASGLKTIHICKCMKREGEEKIGEDRDREGRE